MLLLYRYYCSHSEVIQSPTSDSISYATIDNSNQHYNLPRATVSTRLNTTTEIVVIEMSNITNDFNSTTTNNNTNNDIDVDNNNIISLDHIILDDNNNNNNSTRISTYDDYHSDYSSFQPSAPIDDDHYVII